MCHKAFLPHKAYVHNADGTKVKKTAGSKIVDYLTGFQYENSTLQFFPTSEGYFDVVKNKYIYNYTDHLGNVRLSYMNSGSGVEIIEESNYYPFGLKHEGYNTSSVVNAAYQYKYNGKELQETGMYDYGARFYMPDLGRWGVVDPLAEQYRRHSTYNYAMNNSIRFIDPDGRQGTDWVHNRQTNQVYWNNDAKSQVTAGANETYLGKSGTYSAADGSYVNLNPNASFTNTSFNITNIGIGTNLDPLIQGGDKAPAMSAMAFRNNDGSYIRATPDNPFANPSSQLAYNGLIGMQMAASGIAVEAALGAVGITGGLSLPTTGSVAGDGLGGVGVQTSFKSIPYGNPILHSRIAGQTDMFYAFDNALIPKIMEEGTWTQRVVDGSSFYELSGTMKSSRSLYQGNYEIGVSPENVIFHKAFRPLSKTKL
ncbi:RHS repeat-associated core domain-containing protein [Chryseobacterium indologenes]|nr:RHS repeat-associated core domain-containing protein [Chryseobacterium indologenes]